MTESLGARLKKQARPSVSLNRQVHPIYAQHLERLEAIGFDLERVITIATNAVWAVGWTVPPTDGKWTDAWVHGNYDQAVALVASAEYCRKLWEEGHRLFPAAEFYPEAVERIRNAMAAYQQRLEASRRDREKGGEPT